MPARQLSGVLPACRTHAARMLQLCFIFFIFTIICLQIFFYSGVRRSSRSRPLQFLMRTQKVVAKVGGK
jgi:hypothetical protein